MKNFFQTIFYALTSLSFLYLAGYFIPTIWISPHSCSPRSFEITIINFGHHTGIILPRYSGDFSWDMVLKDIPEGTTNIEFGWGDERFYMAPGFSLQLGLKALFVPTNAVMHVVYRKKHPEEAKRNMNYKKLLICEKDLKQLISYIRSSFTYAGGQLIYKGPGLYEVSSFYAAEGKYHLFRTCNTWIALALRNIGHRTAIIPSTGGSVMWHLESQETKKQGPVGTLHG